MAEFFEKLGKLSAFSWAILYERKRQETNL